MKEPKITLLKKAYEIDFSRIEEGFTASKQWCYANSRNEAKIQLLNRVAYDAWTLKYEDEPITYLTIPVIRNKKLDLVSFDGQEVKRYQVNDLIIEKERHKKLDAILMDDGIKFCYIVKAGVFYRPKSCGYTQYQYKAGVYDKADAVSRAKSCNELWIRPINIEEHNTTITKEIELLQECFIEI